MRVYWSGCDKVGPFVELVGAVAQYPFRKGDHFLIPPPAMVLLIMGHVN